MFHKLLVFFLITAFQLISINICYSVPIDTLVDSRDYHQVEISPNGEYLAVIYDDGNQVRVYVFETNSMKMVGNHGLTKYTPTKLFWVSSKRIAMWVLGESVRHTAFEDYSTLYSVDFNGKHGEYLGRISSLVDPLIKDPKHILISRNDKVLKLNVYTGKTNRISLSPKTKAYTRYFTDQNHNLKIAYSVDSNRNQSLFTINEDGKWSKIENVSMGRYFTPLRLANENVLYALDNFDSDTLNLRKIELDKSRSTTVFSDESHDIYRVEFDNDKDEILAVQTRPSYPAYNFLKTSSEKTKAFKSIIEDFAGNNVSIASQSEDGKRKVIFVSNDTSPGNYYLYSSDKKSITPLVQINSKLNRKKLTYLEPYEFKSSDGQLIRGYVSYPKKSSKKKLPLVVLVHGGPIGVRDYWEYDSELQLLTTNGYAVMKVNFRGSGGYGRKFEEAGFEKWGREIQRDIYEASRWLVEQGRVDDERICIMGSSFGAYSAIQSTSLYPEHYKCAVAYAGVYDLTLLTDELTRKSSKRIMTERLGSDFAVLASQSPINYVEKIKARILLAHGKKDKTASYVHFEKLVDAFNSKKIDYKSMTFSREIHGLNSKKNRIKYYEGVLKFIDESLK